MRRGKLTYPAHAAFELVTAAALLAVPFALGLSFDATLTAGVIGVLLFGLAISATAADGRGTIPVAAHAAYDAAIALVLIGAAVVFGLIGQELALVVLLLAGVSQLLLNSFTRYSVPST